MSKLNHKEGWALKNLFFQIVVLEKTIESPLDSKKIKLVNLKGNQPWIFIGKTDAEAEAPVLWPPDAKSWLIGKDPDSGKGWGQEEKGATEDEIVGWHHQLDGHEFERALGVGDGQGSLACCSPWSHKELDTTEWLNNNNRTLRAPAASPECTFLVTSWKAASLESTANYISRIKGIKPDLELPEHLRHNLPLFIPPISSSSLETKNWPKYFSLCAQSPNYKI